MNISVRKLMAVIAVLAVMLVAGAGYVLATGTSGALRLASAAPLYSEDVVTAVYDAASPAVVEISVSRQGPLAYGHSFQEGQGSGFLIDDKGHILTNNHVVAGATDVQVTLQKGTTVDGEVVGSDPNHDLALVKVDPTAVSGITPLDLADSSLVRPGQMAIAVGSPFGLTDSVTVGVISGINRNPGRIDGSTSLIGMLQTDAALNPGNSGGPLLNARGQVIGINTSIEATAGARGIGFAVPSNVAARALPSLIEGKQMARPWLGISGMALTKAGAAALGLSVEQGVYVITVYPDSPASKAGLKGGGNSPGGEAAPGGDVIAAADGQPVASVQELSAYFNTREVGDTIELSIVRDGRTTDLQVTLAAWPASVQPGFVPERQPQPQPQPRPNIPWPWGRGFRIPLPSPDY